MDELWGFFFHSFQMYHFLTLVSFLTHMHDPSNQLNSFEELYRSLEFYTEVSFLFYSALSTIGTLASFDFQLHLFNSLRPLGSSSEHHTVSNFFLRAISWGNWRDDFICFSFLCCLTPSVWKLFSNFALFLLFKHSG
jgi:hypothetical protein